MFNVNFVSVITFSKSRGTNALVKRIKEKICAWLKILHILVINAEFIKLMIEITSNDAPRVDGKVESQYLWCR